MMKIITDCSPKDQPCKKLLYEKQISIPRGISVHVYVSFDAVPI